LSKKTCRVCRDIVLAASSGSYCYLHQQVYDSLTAEFEAVKKTAKGSSMDWKWFLSEKLSSTPRFPKELSDVIKIELDST
jgi:hypothetical protein